MVQFSERKIGAISFILESIQINKYLLVVISLIVILTQVINNQINNPVKDLPEIQPTLTRSEQNNGKFGRSNLRNDRFMSLILNYSKT
jgi:hypothetical protein